MKAQLEFLQPARAPFALDGSVVVVGQAPDCGLRLDAAGVAQHHARFIVDGAQVWLENFADDSFTMLNDMRLTSRQLLSEGDRIEFGLTKVVFKAQAAAVPSKAGNADRTMMGSEMPAELRQFLEQRQGGAGVVPTTAPAPKATAPQRTVQMDAAQIVSDQPAPPKPTGFTVGTPEPEPMANRTVQMAPAQWPPPAVETPAPRSTTAPRAAVPAPVNPPPVAAPPIATPPAKQPYRPKATMMGIGIITPPAAGAPAPAPAPAQKATAQQSTAFMEAPVLPPKPTAPAPTQNPAPTQKATAQQSTAFMEAPVLPPRPSDPIPQPVAAQPVAVPAAAPVPSPSMKTPVSTPIVPITSASAPRPDATPKTAAPQPYSPQISGQSRPYVPSDPGIVGGVKRALGFMKQMFVLAKENKTLIKPFYLDLAVTTALSILISVCFLFVHSAGMANLLLGLGTALLYFVDYACNSLTASLIYDQVTTGRAEMSDAVPRVKRALKGVMLFAAVSAVLDLASTYARERNDVLSRILVNILRAIWTTATYVIMPALVIEGISFKAAFARSKQLMEVDPTAVGSGVVAMSLVSYAVGFVVFPLAYFMMGIGAHIHPVVGGILFFLFINLYWSTSGWLKISYSTCFYLWARACAEEKGNDVRLAPAPLREALEAA